MKAPYLKLENGDVPNVGDTLYYVSFSDLRQVTKVTVGEQNNTEHGCYFWTEAEAENYINTQIGFDCFCIDGEYFKGVLKLLFAKYKHLNPSKPWRIWLIDNGYQL